MSWCGAAGALAVGLMLLLAAPAWPAGGLPMRGSALAWPLLAGHGRPEYGLAQRAIERSWGPSEDSTYVEVDLPGWRSEGLALGLSAVLPGSGQFYAREGSGLWFALAEVAGWTVNRIYLHKAHTERDRSARFAGDPADPASAWSFERWSEATGLDANEIRNIWLRDRQAFYELIVRDPVYLAGWQGAATATRSTFAEIRGRSRSEYDRAAQAGYVLWLNHLLAAVDALRAARLSNLMLRGNLELKLSSSWRAGQPGFAATLGMRF